MDYTQVLEDLKKYYANLLIVQYNGKSKATKTIKALTSWLLANMIILQIRDGFDWKTAKGKQLDIIGEWVGVSRVYQGSLVWDKTFLSYPKANQLTPLDTTDGLQYGYSTYETFDEDTGGVLTYKNLSLVEGSLDDDDYKTVIGLKIIKNNINFTCKNIDDVIWKYFNERVYTTWQAHEVTYHYSNDLSTIINVCNDKGVLLAPTGCKIVLREI